MSVTAAGAAVVAFPRFAPAAADGGAGPLRWDGSAGRLVGIGLGNLALSLVTPGLMQGSHAALRDTAALSTAIREAAAKQGAEAVIAWSDAVKDLAAPTQAHRFALGGLLEAYAATGEACEAVP